MTFPIILQLLAIIVIIAEIFIPSGGILGIIAIVTTIYSLFKVFNDVSFAAGLTLTIIDVFLYPIIILIGLKLVSQSPAALSKKLSKEEGAISQNPKELEYIGQPGKCLTDLHPSGIIKIGDKRLDVITEGEFINKDSLVQVIKVDGNRIVVEQL